MTPKTALIALIGVLTMTASAQSTADLPGPAPGPLRVCKDNPRYFADPTGKAVYLTGAHTWNNLKDMGNTDPPGEFDFGAYLEFLQQRNHNFIRLWTWELSKYTYGRGFIHARPFPWARTGPGDALDGGPRFDLTTFEDAYFERLRARVVAAGERGIYVSIMLFEGHGLHASEKPWCWDGHPFNVQNNINNIDGDPDHDGRGLESQTLEIGAITKLQEAYVAKVIDSVNDLDNVLYEITNESGSYSTQWQYHLIRFIREHERGKPKQHPVGMTFQFCKEHRGANHALFDSPADWVSPGPDDGYRDNPPAADGGKVILTDTDHLWGIGGDRAWVWKSFCRGLNPIFMDPYRQPRESDVTDQWTDHLGGPPPVVADWEPIRRSLGYTAAYAARMNLNAARPRNDLASTEYCLASPGEQYLVFLPEGGSVTVDLSDAVGALTVEWFDPSTGERTDASGISDGEKREFTAPFKGEAVLFLRRGTGSGARGPSGVWGRAPRCS